MLGLNEFLRSFAELRRCPRGLWVVLFAFVVESMAYFGMLTLMTSYLSGTLGLGDQTAGIMVSAFTMLVTLLMLGVGSYAEGFGIRRAVLAALVLSTVARGFYSAAVGFEVGAAAIVMFTLLIVATGSAILQPVCYAGVKQYTDEKTSSMGYGLIYGLMNLGIVVVGGLSWWARPGVDAIVAGEAATDPGLAFLASFSDSGIEAVNWICTAISAVALVGFALMMTRSVERKKLREEPPRARDSSTPLWPRIRAYFTEGPLGNPRFMFFIFMLLPVRTLFAHQWLTMPVYILRAFPPEVGEHMEILVNWINPLIIFLFVPVFTALTRKVHVYTMMLAGTLVSALPTFLLVGGPSLPALLTYFVLFSLGEAMWSARFYEYASELAPEGKLAQYMGVANIPWLLAKGTTGLYSGAVLARYCAEGVPPQELETGTMWLVYAVIAIMTPLGLWLARGWVMSGLDQPKS